MTKETPKIYVACLASYNAGNLFGEWIDCDQDAESIMAEISEMLKASPIPDAEEWAIHDYDNFHDINISEYCGISVIADLVEFMEGNEEVTAKLIAYLGGSLSEALEQAKAYMEDGYLGEWDSLEDYADNFIDECGLLDPLPQNLRYYFDMQLYARDLELSGDIFTLEGTHCIYVFSSHI